MDLTIQDKVWTKVLTNDTLTIIKDFGLKDVQVTLMSGSGTIAGTLKVGEFPSEPLPLVIGVTINLQTDFGVSPLIIDSSPTGVIHIIGTRG